MLDMLRSIFRPISNMTWEQVLDRVENLTEAEKEMTGYEIARKWGIAPELYGEAVREKYARRRFREESQYQLGKKLALGERVTDQRITEKLANYGADAKYDEVAYEVACQVLCNGVYVAESYPNHCVFTPVLEDGKWVVEVTMARDD